MCHSRGTLNQRQQKGGNMLWFVFGMGWLAGAVSVGFWIVWVVYLHG